MDNSSGSSNENAARERWTRHRLAKLRQQELEQDRRLQRLEHEKAVERIEGGFGYRNPLASTQTDREYDKIMRQREIDRFERLSLKRERGELTKEEARQLRAIARDLRTRGH